MQIVGAPCYIAVSAPEWRNWQTQETQNLPTFGSLGFEPRAPDQSSNNSGEQTRLDNHTHHTDDHSNNADPSSFLSFRCSYFGWLREVVTSGTAAGARGSCRSETMRWFAPDDARHRARLDAWCAGVGVPALHDGATSGASSNIGIQDITFVSWNVHVGSGDIRTFVMDLRNGHHTGAPRCASLRAACCRRPCERKASHRFTGAALGAARIPPHAPVPPIDIVRISRDLGLSLIYVPSMRNGASVADPAEDRGSAILSTLPLSEPIAIELPGERQRARRHRRESRISLRSGRSPRRARRSKPSAAVLDAMDARRADAIDRSAAAERSARDRRRSQYVARTRRAGGAISQGVGRATPLAIERRGSRPARARLPVLSRRGRSARTLPARCRTDMDRTIARWWDGWRSVQAPDRRYSSMSRCRFWRSHCRAILIVGACMSDEAPEVS